jgi:predicted transcriptional regulator
MECKICRYPFDKYVQRRSLKQVKKRISGHLHFGMAFYKYGVCENNHYTKIERTRVDWSHCNKCEKRKDALAQKRRYIEAKKRKEKKEIPTFIRYEFDKFRAEVKKEIRDEVRAEVRAELMEEMAETVKYEVEKTINRIINSDSVYPQVPSPPSPPSSIFSCSEN